MGVITTEPATDQTIVHLLMQRVTKPPGSSGEEEHMALIQDAFPYWCRMCWTFVQLLNGILANVLDTDPVDPVVR